MTAARYLVVLAALAGCGDDVPPPADAPAAAAGCTADFTGNFAETAHAASCVRLIADAAGATTLSLSIPVMTLATKLTVSIDLGASPAPGSYSSETVALWNALASQRLGEGACVYSAGAGAVPPGSFRLALAAIDLAAGTAHGTLSLTQYVLALPGTACGASDTELVTLTF